MPGSTGTPAAAMRRFASSFEPIASTTEAGGPTNTRPAASHERTNAAFSDRNP